MKHNTNYLINLDKLNIILNFQYNYMIQLSKWNQTHEKSWQEGIGLLTGACLRMHVFYFYIAILAAF